MKSSNFSRLSECLSQEPKKEREERDYLNDKVRRLEERVAYLEMQLIVSQLAALRRGK